MEFAVEAISPTRKKVALSLTAEDVNAAIARIVAEYRKDLTLPGFRKGKVPASVVERRFGDEIRSRATSEAVNDSLRQAPGSGQYGPFREKRPLLLLASVRRASGH